MSEPKPKVTREEFLESFESLQASVELNERVFESAEAALGHVAREHYPRLGEWPSQQILALDELLVRITTDFAVKLSSTDHAEIKNEG